MDRSPRIGLLPFYLSLYDEVSPERRVEFMPLVERVRAGFESRSVRVHVCPICCVRSDFETAVRGLEEQQVDLIVTLHLAYSPSLEAIGPLCSTGLPILMLDTTVDSAFGKGVQAERIMYNHGIHGVQDLASLLRRHGRPYRVVAGHVSDRGLFDRAVSAAFGAFAAGELRRSKVLRVGPAFAGMGDFAVEAAVLRRVFGMQIEQTDLRVLAGAVTAVRDDQIDSELRADRDRFRLDIDERVHRRAVRVGLGLRRLLAEGRFSAFSMNFASFTSSEGPVDTVPFLEASKAMSRGIGYAGEGDVLTASLVCALQRAFGATTFTEIFCPDWEGNCLFLSHMGEINPDVLADGGTLLEKPYPFSAALPPAVVTGAPAAGPAVLVNLAPGPNDTFGLIAAPVHSLGDADNESLRTSVRGWIRPACPVADFLEQYSCRGGTHHSALVMGDRITGIEAFAEFAGMDCAVIA